jgi:hypothetical protein
MVAGVVRELGIPLGKNLGINHEDPAFMSIDRQNIRAVISKRNAEYDVWGWKMPHTSEYITEIQGDLRNPFIIVVFRNLIAMAESQMKRSEVTFPGAYKFSFNRLKQVGSIIPDITGPLLAVNYDGAITRPPQFVNEICEFLFLQPDAARRANAEAMINPDVGYRRISREDWRHSVAKTELVDRTSFVAQAPRRRDFNIQNTNGRLERTADTAFVEFVGLQGNRLHISMVRDSMLVDKIRMVVDVGQGFSGTMAERIYLYRGPNVVTIEAASSIRGVRIFPSFEGPVSNVKLFRIFSS